MTLKANLFVPMLFRSLLALLLVANTISNLHVGAPSPETTALTIDLSRFLKGGLQPEKRLAEHNSLTTVPDNVELQQWKNVADKMVVDVMVGDPMNSRPALDHIYESLKAEQTRPARTVDSSSDQLVNSRRKRDYVSGTDTPVDPSMPSLGGARSSRDTPPIPIFLNVQSYTELKDCLASCTNSELTGRLHSAIDAACAKAFTTAGASHCYPRTFLKMMKWDASAESVDSCLDAAQIQEDMIHINAPYMANSLSASLAHARILARRLRLSGKLLCPLAMRSFLVSTMHSCLVASRFGAIPTCEDVANTNADQGQQETGRAGLQEEPPVEGGTDGGASSPVQVTREGRAHDWVMKKLFPRKVSIRNPLAKRDG